MSPTAPSAREDTTMTTTDQQHDSHRPRRLITVLSLLAIVAALIAAGYLASVAAQQWWQNRIDTWKQLDQDVLDTMPAEPTATASPDPGSGCLVEIGAAGTFPDRAEITCADDEPVTVIGDFRSGATNRYDPADAGGVERITVVGQQARVWMDDGDGSCLVISEGAPAQCEPTEGP